MNGAFTFHPYNYILVSRLTAKSDNDKSIFQCLYPLKDKNYETACCTFTGVFGIVLTTLWTESVTKEMAEVKSARTTPAMIDTQSLAPYLAVVVVKMWMTEWMVCHCILQKKYVKSWRQPPSLSSQLVEHLCVKVRLDRDHDHLGEFLISTSIWVGKIL